MFWFWFERENQESALKFWASMEPEYHLIQYSMLWIYTSMVWKLQFNMEQCTECYGVLQYGMIRYDVLQYTVSQYDMITV